MLTCSCLACLQHDMLSLLTLQGNVIMIFGQNYLTNTNSDLMMAHDDSKMVTKVITIHPEVRHDIYLADVEIFYWKLVNLC